MFARQHDVENDHVEFVTARSRESVVTVEFDGGHESLGHQSPPDRLGQAHFVFDHQYSHHRPRFVATQLFGCTQ